MSRLQRKFLLFCFCDKVSRSCADLHLQAGIRSLYHHTQHRFLFPLWDRLTWSLGSSCLRLPKCWNYKCVLSRLPSHQSSIIHLEKKQQQMSMKSRNKTRTSSESSVSPLWVLQAMPHCECKYKSAMQKICPQCLLKFTQWSHSCASPGQLWLPLWTWNSDENVSANAVNDGCKVGSA